MMSPASSSPSLPFVSSAHAYSIACACTCAQRRIRRRLRLGDFKSKRTGTGNFTLSTRSNATNETDDLAESILKNGKITKIAHQLIRQCVREDDVVVDLTCGRGTDTLFFLELVNNATRISPERSLQLLNGQKKYMRYRAEKDPARGMLRGFFGNIWAENYINNILSTQNINS